MGTDYTDRYYNNKYMDSNLSASIPIAKEEWLKIHSIVANRIRDYSDREDVLQIVATSLFFALDRFGTITHTIEERAKYINKITSNICATFYKKVVVEQSRIHDDPYYDQEVFIDLDQVIESSYIRECLNKLSEQHKVILNGILNGQTCIDIAGTICSPEAVRYHYRKAKEAFMVVYLENITMDDI
mgnify:CR=1 FL=1